MKKEAFQQLKRELAAIGLIFIAVFTAFKVIFLTESFFVVLRTVVSIFWLLVLPGFFIMLYWKDELKFFERLIIGIAVGTAITGILSYYTGLLGLHIKYHGALLPLIIIAIGLITAINKK